MTIPRRENRRIIISSRNNSSSTRWLCRSICFSFGIVLYHNHLQCEKKNAMVLQEYGTGVREDNERAILSCGFKKPLIDFSIFPTFANAIVSESQTMTGRGKTMRKRVEGRTNERRASSPFCFLTGATGCNHSRENARGGHGTRRWRVKRGSGEKEAAKKRAHSKHAITRRQRAIEGDARGGKRVKASKACAKGINVCRPELGSAGHRRARMLPCFQRRKYGKD